MLIWNSKKQAIEVISMSKSSKINRSRKIFTKSSKINRSRKVFSRSSKTSKSTKLNVGREGSNTSSEKSQYESAASTTTRLFLNHK